MKHEIISKIEDSLPDQIFPWECSDDGFIPIFAITTIGIPEVLMYKEMPTSGHPGVWRVIIIYKELVSVDVFDSKEWGGEDVDTVLDNVPTLPYNDRDDLEKILKLIGTYNTMGMGLSVIDNPNSRDGEQLVRRDRQHAQVDMRMIDRT